MLAAFGERFLETYAKANNKPSEQASKRLIMKRHLRPVFGTKRLDQIGRGDIEALKARLLAALSPKTVNNVLAVLGRMLRWAQELGLLDRVPRIKLVKVPPQGFDFLDEVEYAKLRDAAASDPDMLVAFLLGADPGLRRGEILGLRWEDVDVRSGKLVVRRSDW
jgi:integrase